ncbi:non-ribosomal peptide synthetase [Burkholderia sp. Ac-20379]|uniref:non-ribosomal peptide synthetase n=1 Tax=Burkholderia sp. Ac-20379 TaxID=2703900 RepID=UPI00197E4859|nr:non-ribosomal peptide synthetase [Burkholderia sp. Ac-20379]MBN3724640.1 amino acid adenylation domain-containing protein [Burkholderia sp. Ac-20379]
MDDVERDLLALLLEDPAVKADHGAGNEIHGERAAPLSAIQRNLWYLQQIEPASTAYNLDRIYLIEGDLDEVALRQTLQYVSDRHDVLRSRIVDVDGTLSQVVDPAFQFPLTIEPPAVATHDVEQTIADFVRRHRARSFDLASAAPVRAALLRIGARQTLLAFSMHHIVTDAWSNAIWMQELAAAYDVFRRSGMPPELPALPQQYRHYALRQRDYLAGEPGRRDLAYWRNYLGDATEALSLPDSAAPGIAAEATGHLVQRLDHATLSALDAYCATHRVGRFAALLGIWQVVLGKASGQSSFLIGVPSSGRLWPDVEPLIGCFVNTHVYRAALSPSATLGDVVRAAHVASVNAMNHGNLPFDSLLAELGVPRLADRHPLFQVLFDYKVADTRRVAFGDVDVKEIPAPAAQRKFDLTLSVTADAAGIELEFDYAAHRFDAAAVAGWGQAYASLLAELTGAPDVRRIGAFDLLDAAQRRRLDELGRGAAPWSNGHPTILSALADSVADRPDATAVVCGQQSLTYRELDLRANRLAHRLVALGIRPEMRVGCAIGRSVDLIVGLLAILKAGAAYVPLDPHYPRDRLAAMTAHSGMSLLLTTGDLVARVPVPAGVDVLAVDTLDLSAGPDTAPHVTIDGRHLAYLIYTSGSTGRPKGVAVSHAALAMHAHAVSARYALQPDDRLLQFASISFDAAQEQWLAPLLAKAAIVLADDPLMSPAQLIGLVREKRVTVLYLPPAYIDELARQTAPGTLALRCCIVGGEAWSRSGFEAVRDRLCAQRIFNAYGPAETVISPTLWQADAGTTLTQPYVPVGVAVGMRRLYVLDTGLQRMPPGAIGELYIGGAAIARGYLDAPAMTAERFVPDPFEADGSRMYRSGDLVRWNADGDLEFVGRIDHQVKIRGYRVELGEIEANLLARDEIREAVVVARESANGKRLIAYVTAQAGGRAEPDALRAALAAVLPEYMVPSAFVVLDALPLSPNGKVDRKALPDPSFVASAHYAAPVGAVEHMLADVWSAVLGCERIGRHDNFFELGGDSILSLKVAARSAAAGVPMAPRLLFEHQTIAALAVAIDLSRDREALPDDAAAVPLTVVPRDGELPLSHAQQRQWFLWKLQPHAGAYHILGAVRLRGRLDVAALHASFDALVMRHESLRTTFSEDADGRVGQRIHAALPHDRQALDLSGADDAGTALSDWVAALTEQPFDLSSGPLLRVGVARVGASEHVLVVAIHHIVSDGWSMDVLLREFVDGYRALTSGQAFVQDALPIQYADYAVWQRRWLEAGEQDRQLAYWRARLGGAQPVLALPADRPRQALGAYRAASERLDLPAGLGRALVRVARQHNATPFMVLLAAFDVVLHRYTGEQDIRVGVPVANRDRPETAGLIGFFVNTQVLKADIDGRTTLASLLEQVRARCLEAQAHQDLPFDVLVDALQPERSLSHTPLFQVAFNHQRSDDRALEHLDGLSIEAYELGEGAAQFELTLNTHETPDGALHVSLRYARELFDVGTMQRFGRHYVRVLEALTGDLSSGVDEIALLDAQERDELLTWGRNDVAYPNALPVHERIAARAQATPDAVAVVYGEQSLRYGELDARANRLAHRLAKHGVGPEVRVGIAVERSIEMIVGLLAILKAGGAYVPLDPDYPQDRLSYMIEDSGIALVLTQSGVRNTLPIPSSLAVLELDGLDLSSEPDTAPAVKVAQGNLAYVIYTSGSTGRPKGAQLAHHNVARLLDATEHWFHFDENDVWTMFHSYAFDFSVWEIFGALCYGGKLVVVPFVVSRSPEEFAALLRRERVTVLNQTPSAFRQLMAVPGIYDGEPLALREVIFGGEALEPQTLAPWIARFGDAQPRLVNMYGITETTVHVTYRPIGANDLNEGVSPVGVRIPDLGIYVLDAERNLVPVGVTGELYVGGSGVARGYLNRASLTAERFVPDPFGANGERLYRTGDLARWTADGALEYLGRIDHQVKIRGFRIELGEIDAQLLAQAGVRESITLAQEGPSGARLVSYVTAKGDAALDGQALRTALGATLPDYMVPTAILPLAALPLTANGKVDRKALPQPEFESAAVYAAPEGEAEAALASIWRDVLGIERVGRHDNFFELGGDSILSLQIVARAREAGWKITPRQMFERQTLALLASVAQRIEARVAAPAVESGGVPLLPIQSWFFAIPMAQRHHWNQSVLLEGTQPLDSEMLAEALRAVVAHHGALRLRYTHDSTRDNMQAWHQAYADDAEVAARATLLWERHVAHADEIGACCTEAQRSLDLGDGPLLRALVIRLPDGGWRLLLAIHHLVVDGVSWRILLEDLQTAYARIAEGKAVVLPSRGASYQEWAQRLADRARSEAVRAELPYWTEIAAAPVGPRADHADRDALTADVRTASRQLDSALTRRLLQDVPAAYRTQINDILLTALGRALCAMTGTDSIRIDLEGHGREDSVDDLDLSRTVGWFTSLYPVCLAPLGQPGEALLRVKETLRAVPGRGIGFGLLKYLGDTAAQSALAAMTPSSVAFNYLGQFDRVFASDAGWRPSSDDSGQAMDPAAALTHDLSIGAKVYDGMLSISMAYSGERFEASTVDRLLAAYVGELEALIAYCTCGAAGVSPSDFPLAALTQSEIDRLPMQAALIEDIYPLSPMQAGMLFHSLLAPAGSTYLNQMRIDIGGCDVDRFVAAWEAATRHHAILRTAFVQRDDAWLQWVASEVALPFVEHDWREREGLDAALDTLAADQLKQGFDLTRPPLQRLVMVRTGAQSHHLIWTHHHILMDGWSMSRLMGEVLRHYDGGVTTANGGRYRDYIEWLGRRDAGASETYWRERLAEQDAPTRIASRPLPADGNMAAGRGHCTVELDAAATERLVAFARACRVTVNTLVQAAWSLVLQRHTGQTSVAFGATVAGRPAELVDVEQLLGLFINTVPVATAPRADTPIGAWLQALQAQGIASQEHAHAPLYEIQRWTGAGTEGWFDTLLVFENYPVDEALQAAAPAGLSFGRFAFREETSYPLTLTATVAERLTMTMNFSLAQFEASAVARFGSEFDRALCGLVEAGAQACVGTVSLLDRAGREAALSRAVSRQAFDETRLVHVLFGEQAAATPDAVAVVFGGEAWRYRELDRRANRLAHRLMAAGVGPEVRVGIAVERSIAMLVSVLAVLKAGGAYVPIDPEYPADRIAYVVEDSALSVLLTQAAVRDRLTVPGAPTVFDIDALDLSGEPDGAPAVTVCDAQMAYMIYTSGSTGRPKGVMVRHDALTNFLLSTRRVPGMTPDDRLVAVTSLSFDIAGLELFLPLISGARVVIADRDTTRDGAALARLIRESGATILQSTPSTWRMLLDADWQGDLTGLCGGEALPPDLAAALRDAGVRLWNMYGPTETTIWSSAQRVEGLPSLGDPLAATQLYVLDGGMNPVPLGAPGELYIGGAGVARGYWQRPGLTAERFVPDPFAAGADGARLYRTGDLVRWRDDGTLDYLSRIDHQVKIRGFRIELGEIEARIVMQPAVREAVVTALPGAGGGLRLVAYVCTVAGETLDAAGLRDALLESLPAHMVPTALVLLEALPLTPNGKIDRKALPAPEMRLEHYEAPIGAAEQALAEVWRDVLAVPRVGRHDNFFELGGHSLLALQAQRRLSRQLGVEVPLTAFFSGATLSEMAQTSLAGLEASKAAQQQTVSDMQALLDDLID